MSRAPDGVVTVDHGGTRYSLLLDWTAIAFFERETDASLIDFYAGLVTGRPKLSHLAYFLLAMMQRHHPEVTLDMAGQMAMDDAVRAKLDLAAAAAMPAVDGSGSGEGNGGAAAG